MLLLRSSTAFDLDLETFVCTAEFDIFSSPLSQGVIYKSEGSKEFDIPAFLAHLSPETLPKTPKTLVADGPETSAVKPLFEGLNTETLVDYIKTKTPDLAAKLGGDGTDWKVREVGDGNLNLVFIVEGPKWACVLKQSLPYVRCVGESWPLTVDRSWFEALALKEEGRLVPEHVPEVRTGSHFLGYASY